MSAPKILIVDDDKDEQNLIRNILDLDNFYTCVASDGPQAIATTEKEQPNLILLDLRLPGMDGFEVCRLIRSISSVPIIAVSGLKSLEERERFLNSGGNDYITKPYMPEELRFRVWAALKKVENEQMPSHPQKFDDGNLIIDFGAHLVTVKGEEVRFTTKELVVLSELVRNLGTCVTYDQLLKAAWGSDYTNMNALYLCISRIRDKIETGPNPRYIITIPRTGYRFGKSAAYSLLVHKPLEKARFQIS